MNKLRFSSKRFLLTLMLCACSVILLQNSDLSPNASFSFNIICMLCGLSVCFLLFVPSLIIKRRTGLDFLTVARVKTPSLRLPTAVFYSLYLIFTAEFFLLPYTDMFAKKYYSGVTPCAVALLLVLTCVYAAVKGVNVITRFGIFLFGFAFVTNALMFGGSLGSLDFSLYGFELSGGSGDFWRDSLYFVTPAFIAVLYACLSGATENFRLRQPVFALIFTGVKFALVLFFIFFSLGDYAGKQEYPTFTLSRAARLGSFGGIESFYLALATMSVFMIISLILCAATKSVKRESNVKYVAVFAAIIFSAHICGTYIDSVKEIFTSTGLFVILTAAAALVPLGYVFTGRKSNARKALRNTDMP